MSFILLTLTLLSAPQNTSNTTHASLVAENRAKFSFENGVLDLRSGGGWLRTSRLFLDFDIEFEFRAATPEVDASVMVRSWAGRELRTMRGFVVALPTDRQIEISSLLVGRREKVAVVQEGRVDLRSADEWQKMRIIGDGSKLSVLLNNTLAGVFEVDSYGGHILFGNRKGRIQLRNIQIRFNDANLAIPADVITAQGLSNFGGRTPELRHEVKPRYTLNAMKRSVEGKVGLEAVVLADGSTGGVRITKSLDSDLDLSAIAALRAWRFQPALLNGKPVPVIVHVEMTFTMR